MSKKLEKVLEYLINNQEDAAKELLHQVFIEKARSIHEELINMEDEEEMDENGDMGDHFGDEVGQHSAHLDELSDEIDAEETMAETEDDMDTADAEGNLGDDMGSEDGMMDMGGDMDDMGSDDMGGDMDDMDDMGSEEVGGGMEKIESTMDELEDMLASLKAQFEKLESGDDSEADMGGDMDDMGGEDMEDAEGDEGMEDAEGEEGMEDAEGEEDEMDESWLAEFDDLEESVDMDKATIPSNAEVGAGKYAKAEANTKSPVATSQKELFGAKPVVTGKGAAKSGYERETAPSSAQLAGVKDNRRKKATDGQSSVSKEGSGSSMLSKSQGEGGKKSPLTNSPRK